MTQNHLDFIFTEQQRTHFQDDISFIIWDAYEMKTVERVQAEQLARENVQRLLKKYKIPLELPETAFLVQESIDVALNKWYGTLAQPATRQPLLLEPFQMLDRDLQAAASTLTPNAARYLVDFYYAVQNYRIRFGNQIRALSESGEPHELIVWMYENAKGLEHSVQKSLDVYSMESEAGRWARSIAGVGPVIAAGLLAHIDITRAPSTGHIWSFAGLNPEQRWEKGQKRPWNARLKVLVTFKLGESFVKVQNRSQDIYGHIYAARKKLEQEANDYLFYAEQAARILATKKIGKDTDAFKYYSASRLPPAHIHARARRYAVKLFLAHLHDVWYEIATGEQPPKPYVIEHLGHVDMLMPPHWPLDEDAQQPAQSEEHVEPTVQEAQEQAARLDQQQQSGFVPRAPLYLTLELQLQRFKETLATLEETPASFEPELLLSGYVPAAQLPTLEERIRRYRAMQRQS